MSEQETTQSGPEQSSDLFSYIGQSQFQAVNDPSLVEQLASETPVETGDDNVGENVDQAASTQETAPVVTTPQQGTDEVPGAGQPTQEPVSDEALRYQQRIEQLEAEKSQRDMALALIANQARQREEALFNRSLELMTPEEQEQAKETRRVEQLEAENNLLRTGEARRRQAEEQSQERVDKIEVVHKVMTRLGLPSDDQLVMTALMDSQSPAELFAVANRMAQTFRSTQQQQQQQIVREAVQSNVLSAGGETAPATQPKKVAQRSGELVDMMRERQYTSEEIR